MTLFIILAIIWYLVGYVGAVLVQRQYEDVRLSDLVIYLLISFLGPIFIMMVYDSCKPAGEFITVFKKKGSR